MAHFPPFRADMVGSLLRTARLKDARAQRAAGAITAEQLRSVEDAEITALIRKEEAIGLDAVTDGEFRAFLVVHKEGKRDARAAGPGDFRRLAVIADHVPDRTGDIQALWRKHACLAAHGWWAIQ